MELSRCLQGSPFLLLGSVLFPTPQLHQQVPKPGYVHALYTCTYMHTDTHTRTPSTTFLSSTVSQRGKDKLAAKGKTCPLEWAACPPQASQRSLQPQAGPHRSASHGVIEQLITKASFSNGESQVMIMPRFGGSQRNFHRHYLI